MRKRQTIAWAVAAVVLCAVVGVVAAVRKTAPTAAGDDIPTSVVKRGDLEIEVENAEWINRCRLQVDTRKWLMSKLVPKKYGDKQLHTGADGEGPAVFVLKSILDKE